jgi:hydrogenase-4 component B
MQYSSGSFAGIVVEWFGWILHPLRKLRRPRGQFPASAILLERTPETVLEMVIEPISRGIIRISTAVRRLQHGRLQSYILYVLAGLFALGVLVLLGVKS